MTVDKNVSAIPTLAQRGFTESTAATDLAAVGWTAEEHSYLLWSLSRSPDASLALRALARLCAAQSADWPEIFELLSVNSGFRGRLLALLGSSTALGDHIIAEPGVWRVLVAGELPTREALVSQMLDCVEAFPVPGPATEEGEQTAEVVFKSGESGPKAVVALRSTYRTLLVQLAAADVAATVEDEPVLSFTQVGEYLSDLADAALTAALAVAVARVFPGDKPVTTRLAVIAMGKCGARELNYLSDVDVIFVAEPADGTSSRLAGEFMQIGTSAFFEVDAALRPEGKAGALTRTLESHLSYYKRWAKTWEFQALLKARPMTGDLTLAAAYVAAVQPLIWLACERDDFVADVQAMRRRVESNIPERERDRELKLGRGGLRDVEFAVQLLQLVHGRMDNSLRVLSTVDALSVLTSRGYVGRNDGANFKASYEFLRLLEHRLQLQRMKRTHLLPEATDVSGLRWLARAAHMRPEGEKDSTAVLLAEVTRQRERVRTLHEKLFYRPLLASITEFSTEELGLSDEAATSRLAALGYVKPNNALTHLRALVSAEGRRGQIQQLLLPTLLDWLSQTPDPDIGLLNYRRLCDEIIDREWFLRLLRDEGIAAQRLMQVLGSSVFISELLMHSPEVTQLYADGSVGPKLVEVAPEEVAQGLVATVLQQTELKRAIEVARAERRVYLARIASADLLGMLTVPEVCAALSKIWSAVLEAALLVVIRESVAANEKYRESGAPASMAVIGMGRLGGAELGYGSDADVLFVCETAPGVDETEAVKWANSIADQVRKLLSTPSVDPPLEVDTGLRPEGRNGPVVRSYAAYAQYYEQWAKPWEIQALLRATYVAGDKELGIKFLHMADKIRYPEGGVDTAAVREIRRIKARVDAERLPRGADPATHTKLGRGGLADVEWTVQLVQLLHAHEYPALHNTSTLESLDAIGDNDLLTADEVAQLKEAWLTATQARNALVLVRGKPVDQLPGPGAVLNAVAHAAGWPEGDSGEFLDNYLKVTRRAKAVVLKVFGQ